MLSIVSQPYNSSLFPTRSSPPVVNPNCHIIPITESRFPYPSQSSDCSTMTNNTPYQNPSYQVPNYHVPSYHFGGYRYATPGRSPSIDLDYSSKMSNTSPLFSRLSPSSPTQMVHAQAPGIQSIIPHQYYYYANVDQFHPPPPPPPPQQHYYDQPSEYLQIQYNPVVQNQIIPIQPRRKYKQSIVWCPKEDKLLRKLKQVDKLGWKEISSFFQGRTPNACQFRWRRLVSVENSLPASDPSKSKSHHSIDFLLNE